MTDLERFMAKVVIADRGYSTLCHEWIASTKPNGYGQFRASGRNQYAHRWIYEHRVGSIPAGLTVDHLCKNIACMNTDHMELVTAGENALRGNGPAALNKRKTHCKRGHAFTDVNLLVTSIGRRCRECERLKYVRVKSDPERHARLLAKGRRYDAKRRAAERAIRACFAMANEGKLEG